MYLFVVEEDLSLTDKIYLASLLRECLHEEAEYIEKINQKDITIKLIISYAYIILKFYYSLFLLINIY